MARMVEKLMVTRFCWGNLNVGDRIDGSVLLTV